MFALFKWLVVVEFGEAGYPLGVSPNTPPFPALEERQLFQSRKKEDLGGPSALQTT